MGLLRGLMGMASLHEQTSNVKNARQQIFVIRDRLRGTNQFAELFHKIIGNVERPPIQIVGDYFNHSFYSIGWDEKANNYEPFSTLKASDGNIAYYEAAAIFLLMQECYPNVYDFPNRTMTQLEMGVSIELNMKKEFVGKRLRPAILPEKPQILNNDFSRDKKFCSQCGAQLAVDSNFCCECGSKISS